MKPIKLIPQFYAGDLPELVEEELRDWQDELCFHGDGGCVFVVRADDRAKLPLFIEWLSQNGIDVNCESITCAMTGT